MKTWVSSRHSGFRIGLSSLAVNSWFYW